MNMKKTSILMIFILIAFCEIQTEKDPDIITQRTKYDTDDPAIWVNEKDPSKSIVFGTDKNKDGAVYAFDLQGRIIKDKTIGGLKKPNNIDIRYNFKINDSKIVDVLAVTERERNQVRLFSVPDMKPLDNGGFKVFKDQTELKRRTPMGISFYQSPVDNSLYIIVGRKDGPKENYLHQYKVERGKSGLSLKLVRKFGKFSGVKEIEAIAVDDELGYVYYSDETYGVRKYYAEPSKGNEELPSLKGGNFVKDIEGIAIVPNYKGEGFIIVSNQHGGTFNVYSRKGNDFISEVDLGTSDTDGCEVTSHSLNETFKNGLFVAMNNSRNFYYYDLQKLLPTPEKG